LHKFQLPQAGKSANYLNSSEKNIQILDPVMVEQENDIAESFSESIQLADEQHHFNGKLKRNLNKLFKNLNYNKQLQCCITITITEVQYKGHAKIKNMF
jgi:hypothetical protein